MTLRLYRDHNVGSEIIEGVRKRDVDVLTAMEDGRDQAADSLLFARAIALQRVLFSHDVDFLAIAGASQKSGTGFPGLVFAHQLHATIGQCIDDLELICWVMEPDEIENRVIYIPL